MMNVRLLVVYQSIFVPLMCVPLLSLLNNGVVESERALLAPCSLERERR